MSGQPSEAPPPAGRAVVVHGLAHALAAVEAAARLSVPVTLVSAPDAAGYAGAAWFLAVVRRASAARPQVAVSTVLDCGDAPGLVLGALREGCRRVRFTGPAATAARLGDIAAQLGATVETGAIEALDLLESRDPVAACLAWLRPDGETP